MIPTNQPNVFDQNPDPGGVPISPPRKRRKSGASAELASPRSDPRSGRKSTPGASPRPTTDEPRVEHQEEQMEESRESRAEGGVSASEVFASIAANEDEQVATPIENQVTVPEAPAGSVITPPQSVRTPERRTGAINSPQDVSRDDRPGDSEHEREGESRQEERQEEEEDEPGFEYQTESATQYLLPDKFPDQLPVTSMNDEALVLPLEREYVGSVFQWDIGGRGASGEPSPAANPKLLLPTYFGARNNPDGVTAIEQASQQINANMPKGVCQVGWTFLRQYVDLRPGMVTKQNEATYGSTSVIVGMSRKIVAATLENSAAGCKTLVDRTMSSTFRDNDSPFMYASIKLAALTDLNRKLQGGNQILQFKANLKVHISTLIKGGTKDFSSGTWSNGVLEPVLEVIEISEISPSLPMDYQSAISRVRSYGSVGIIVPELSRRMEDHVKAANSSAETIKLMHAANRFETMRMPIDENDAEQARQAYDKCQKALKAEVMTRYNTSTASGSDRVTKATTEFAILRSKFT